MAFCTQCGKEIPEGGVCDCTKTAQPDSPAKKKKSFIPVLAGLIAVIVLVLACMIYISVNAYKKPIKTFAKGINRHSTELLLESVLSDGNYDRLKQQISLTGKEWDDYIKDADKSMKKDFKDSGLKKIKIEFTDKEKIKGDELNIVRGLFTIIDGSEVKKAYSVTTDITIKKKNGSETKKAVFYVVKIDDENWKCLPYDADLGININNYIGY